MKICFESDRKEPVVEYEYEDDVEADGHCRVPTIDPGRDTALPCPLSL